jgi:hypothetical protein
MYSAMCSSNCELCGGVAPYFYLPTAIRVCGICIDNRNFDIATSYMSSALAEMRDLGAVTGTSADEQQLRRNLRVVRILEPLHKEHEPPFNPQCLFAYRGQLEILNSREAEAFLANASGMKPDPLLTNVPRDHCTIILPWFSDDRRKVEPMLGCKGCLIFIRDNSEMPAATRRRLKFPTHCRSSLLAHILKCAEAQSL